MSRSDAELIDAALEGDVAAFGILYERYWSMVVGTTFNACGDRHLAEDIAQDVFATAARQLTTLRDRTRLPRWLRTIARRTARRVCRRRRTWHALELEPPTSDPSTESALADEHESRLASLTLALQKLDERSREVLILRYYSDLTHEEMSRTLGVTAAAVHGRLQRARQRLAKLLPHDSKRGAHDASRRLAAESTSR